MPAPSWPGPASGRWPRAGGRHEPRLRGDPRLSGGGVSGHRGGCTGAGSPGGRCWSSRAAPTPTNPAIRRRCACPWPAPATSGRAACSSPTRRRLAPAGGRAGAARPAHRPHQPVGPQPADRRGGRRPLRAHDRRLRSRPARAARAGRAGGGDPARRGDLRVVLRPELRDPGRGAHGRHPRGRPRGHVDRARDHPRPFPRPAGRGRLGGHEPRARGSRAERPTTPKPRRWPPPPQATSRGWCAPSPPPCPSRERPHDDRRIPRRRHPRRSPCWT